MVVDPRRLRVIIEETLSMIEMQSSRFPGRTPSNNLAWAKLLWATAYHESRQLQHRLQHPRGPARGIFQTEVNTHDDVWRWVIRSFRDDNIARLLHKLSTGSVWSVVGPQQVGFYHRIVNNQRVVTWIEIPSRATFRLFRNFDYIYNVDGRLFGNSILNVDNFNVLSDPPLMIFHHALENFDHYSTCIAALRYCQGRHRRIAAPNIDRIARIWRDDYHRDQRGDTQEFVNNWRHSVRAGINPF